MSLFFFSFFFFAGRDCSKGRRRGTSKSYAICGKNAESHVGVFLRYGSCGDEFIHEWDDSTMSRFENYSSAFGRCGAEFAVALDGV